MAKRHGCGFPIWSYQIFWGPHATTNPPAGGGIPCPRLTFLRPDRDPWVASGDRDHRHRITDTSLLPPYYGLAEGQRCWTGGAMGVAPHGVGIVPRLRQAFADGKLGDPAIWDGEPNEQEIDLMNISQEAWQLLGSMTPQQPAPPVPPPPPVDPPVPPPVDPPLLTRVRALEQKTEGLALLRVEHNDMIDWRREQIDPWIAGPNTLNQHPDFVGLVEIFKRRVEALEDTAARLESRSHEANRRLDALERGTPGLPPAPPSPPQPPGLEPGEKLLGQLSLPGDFYRATAEEPSRAYVVAIEGAPSKVSRVNIRFRVKMAGDLDDGRRREIYSCTFNGRGQDGIPAYLFVDGRADAGVFRAGDAWNPAKGPFSKEAVRIPDREVTVKQLCDWTASNLVGVMSADQGHTTLGHLPSPTTPKRSLVVNFGIPQKYADANPQEATSVGFVWSNLVVEVWS